MKIAYTDQNFQAKTLAIILTADKIVAEYAAQGFNLTLRQLFYQFVARDLLPNTEQSYNRIGSIISDARRAGLIDWEAIEDRTRFLRKRARWEGPKEIIEAVVEQFHIDMWKNQEVRLEVWIEKDALVGVIERECNMWDIPFFSCRGYPSDSEVWRAAMRINDYSSNGQRTVILHLGDHDPSGLDMTRDIEERLELFVEYGTEIEIRRIALNYDQVEQYNPPPNPAKLTDSRVGGYMARYGRYSWELDALDPPVIAALIREEYEREVDPDKWADAVEQEEAYKAQLQDLADGLEE